MPPQIVPQVPQSMQCWEVTPGEVRGIKTERVPGGTKVTIPEFGLTTEAVLQEAKLLLMEVNDDAH